MQSAAAHAISHGKESWQISRRNARYTEENAMNDFYMKSKKECNVIIKENLRGARLMLSGTESILKMLIVNRPSGSPAQSEELVESIRLLNRVMVFVDRQLDEISE